MNIDEMTAFCKRKGFVVPSCEIYGGVAGLYDYAHLGTLLKKNFENVWRAYFLGLNPNFFEIEASEIMHAKVFEASGHVEHFVDPVAYFEDGSIARADHLLEKLTGSRHEELNAEQLFEELKKHGAQSSSGKPLKRVAVFNMMFPVNMGVIHGSKAFLRAETAQSPYVNFKQQFEFARKKLPLGIALIGRAFRNEISPRNFILRQRAFTQAELQIFFDPEKIEEHEDFGSVADYTLRLVRADKRDEVQEVKCSDVALPQFYVYHLAKVQQFYLDVLGISREKFRLYELNDKEKAFYNKFHFDVEANLGAVGWTEIGGVHYRTDHDLKGHARVSQKSLEVLDEKTKRKFVPHVLELSFGVDRNFYTLIDFAYEKGEKRAVLKLPPQLAPFQCAVFPLLSNKPELVGKAKEVFGLLKGELRCTYDTGGSIGRRYARQDEVGTPYCVTVDFDGLEDGTVTVRDRDSTEQKRVKIDVLVSLLKDLISSKKTFSEL